MLMLQKIVIRIITENAYKVHALPLCAQLNQLTTI